MTRFTRRLFTPALILLLVTADTSAQITSRTAAARPARARLVVGIIIDQFRYDYLSRFEDLYGEGGFRRLMREGAVFANANYIYSPTVTAPGHATMMSGSTPAVHGIVGNDWFDRATGKTVTSVLDESVKPVGIDDVKTGGSPRRLIGSTVGDQLRLHTNGKSKVIGISFKDRSAIMPAGKHPTAAYWYSSETGEFVSSTYYLDELPAWVKQFHRDNKPDKYFGAKWERLMPASAYERSAADAAAYEKSGYGNTFPYTINGGGDKPGPKFYDQFGATPFANDYTAAFAKAAIENEALGQDDHPDLLTISFSANDAVGHTYGPHSQETQDITVRTDRVLADLFAYIDRRVGLQNTIVVLTADHGVAPVPEQMTEYKLGGRYQSGAIRTAVEKALGEKFGADKYVLAYANGSIYFDYDAIERRKASREEVERVGAAAAMNVEGVAECFARSDILAGKLPLTPVAEHVARGFHEARSGDLVIVQRPFYLSGTSGTSHGTPYSYDTHVPVIFLGYGVKAGTFYSASSPSDIAPTLAALLRIEPPSNVVGRVLGEAVAPANSAPAARRGLEPR